MNLLFKLDIINKEMKHYKVNHMKGRTNEKGFGPNLNHFDTFINTNQYVCWTFINDLRYKSFVRIQKGDILHMIIPKSSANPQYYRGKVLSELIIDEEYKFSTNILQWDWSTINRDTNHNGKKELKYIVEWEKRDYPCGDLYNTIMKGYNAQTIKEILF